MADRDRAAVHVHLRRIETELADDDEGLRCERFVELHEVEFRGDDAGSLQQLAHGRNRTDSHHTRVDSGDGVSDERGERLGPELARFLLGSDHERSGTVVDPRRVAGGDAAVLTKRGLERSKLLGTRIGTRMLVAYDAVDRNELVVETPCFRRSRPTALRLQRELILFLTRD